MGALHRGSSTIRLLLTGVAASLAAAAVAQTRFEAEAIGSPRTINDVCGYDSINGVVARSADPAASGGETLFACGTNRNLKFLFRGTGVDLIVKRQANGDTFDWILDEGAASGSSTTYSPTTDNQFAIPIRAQGTLADTLHTLEIRPTLSGGGCVVIDAIDVYDSSARIRTEDTATGQITYSSGHWVVGDTGGDAAAEASGGQVSYTTTGGATATFSFTGKAVAITGVARSDAKRVNWDIDGTHTGTVDFEAANALGFGFWHRWPFVLKNDLPPGPHTLTLTADTGWVFVLDAIDVAGAAEPPTHWASHRGLYVFNSSTLLGPWGPRQWTLAQWETWLDTMQFLNLNHLQLPRAPWSERPAQTQYETDQEELWRGIFQAAHDRGMTTSVVLQTTAHGDLTQPWRMLSPNNPAHPNWTTLVSDYDYWGQRYGALVDEWYMGAEDPGGCPVCGNTGWPFVTPTAQCSASSPVCTVTDYLGLLTAARTEYQEHNPAARVISQTWGLDDWGIAAGYSSHLDEYLAGVPVLPSDVPLCTHARDDSLTDTLQATGRPVRSWPFYLIDHEFPNGHTKLHFGWTQSYLQQISDQGIDSVVCHITHPIEQLPSIYIYSRLLEDTSLSKLALLQEFAELLVSDPADQTALATAISELGLFWDSVSGVANWDAVDLWPIESTPPYAPRYNATQLAWLDTALANISTVDSPRATPGMPMLITPAEWVQMLRDQIEFLHDGAYMGNIIVSGGQYLDDNHDAVADLPEPLTRPAAQAIVDAFRAQPNPQSTLDDMESYLLQFWVNAAGQNHPLGIIYDYLVATVPTDTPGSAMLSGDFLEYAAPSYPRLFKQLDGLTEESEPNFSYVDSAAWTFESRPEYSGGTARLTSTANTEVNILFSGTGLWLIHSRWPQGGNVQWTIDGGAGGSGTVSMNAAAREDQVHTLLTGTLEQTLHVLTLRNLGTGGGNSMLVDAIDVLSNGRLRREENREMFSYSGAWTEDANPEHSDGTMRYTLADGASCTVPFEGTAVAIGFTRRADYGTMSWSIDGGAGGSGSISLSGPHNTRRHPHILATGLADGPHTLVLTKTGGFLANIDSVDTVRPVPAEAVPCGVVMMGPD